jgi:hypothetical protein
MLTVARLLTTLMEYSGEPLVHELEVEQDVYEAVLARRVFKFRADYRFARRIFDASPELLRPPIAFLRAISNADYLTAFDVGNLTDNRVNSSCQPRPLPSPPP